MNRPLQLICAVLCTAALIGSHNTAWAEELRPSVAESFPIGNSGTVCQAQGVAMGAARQSVFDRKWALLCADVAAPIGTAVAVRSAVTSISQVAGDCTTDTSLTLAGVTALSASNCRNRENGLGWRVYSARSGKVTYVVEGLAAYDSALQLMLRGLVADRALPGEIAVASTGAGTGADLAKAQAAISDPQTMLGQGYRRNNAGAYAEAAEFFQPSPSAQTLNTNDDPAERLRQRHELLINRALQLSNLGEFDQSAKLFAQAHEMLGDDPVGSRLRRNFEVIDALNRGDQAGALAVLDQPMPSLATLGIASDEVRLDTVTASSLNVAKRGGVGNVMGQEERLTPAERVMMIDAQADGLRGTMLRIAGQPAQAARLLASAHNQIVGIREGRVISAIRLRSQLLSERALALEAQGENGEAEEMLQAAIDLVNLQYPDSASLNAAQARMASFLLRHGTKDQARQMYQAIVSRTVGNRGALVGMANQMQPYFRLLAEDNNPDAVGQLFLASQLIERPGASDTLAQLARRLQGGDSAASELFRQSLTISREIERGRIAMAALRSAPPTEDTASQIATLTAQHDRLLKSQATQLSALSAFPQYRSFSRSYLTADETRALLGPDEAYLKTVQLGTDVYAIYLSASRSAAWRLASGSAGLSADVSQIRDTISTTLNGVQETYPIDLDTAVKLSDGLLGPVAGDLASVRHLIFEPDGALLQLPVNLLITDKAGVSAYHARVDAGGDEYDFRGIQWLGRGRAISTALSAASFRDARKAPRSTASKAYLGLGQNQPVAKSASPLSLSDDCSWTAATWNRPIADVELREAAKVLGKNNSDVLTGTAFTDSAIKSRGDIGQYRIVHFATHGLVTAPREGCPAKPALLTSFGSGDSDGLLQFDEIFDLHLDADLVLLSACDTAGQASLEATREAGLTSGGGQALDGLVRAFIGAGGRQVIASHWPAPDDYGATRRLVSGLFGAKSGETVGHAMQLAQQKLMDDPQTSHPFYWAGFAVIGDGAQSLVTAR